MLCKGRLRGISARKVRNTLKNKGARPFVSHRLPQSGPIRKGTIDHRIVVMWDGKIMNALTGHIGFELGGVSSAPKLDDEVATSTAWGYIVNNLLDEHHSALRSIASRFLGSILLMSGIGLWLIPDSIYGAEIFVMKMGAMVMFIVFGGALLQYGRQRPGIELQVDTNRQELRLGNRTIAGEFKLIDMLRFDEVGSVYLLRNAAQGQPSRLFLRIGKDGETGIEILRGTQKQLERVRLKLLDDFASARRF